LLVRAIEGDYLNVVGLPVAALVDLAPWLIAPR
jgi:predicted house-cleaning NTP pyrophosphatase (Maf/HAM1 superfamily)